MEIPCLLLFPFFSFPSPSLSASSFCLSCWLAVALCVSFVVAFVLFVLRRYSDRSEYPPHFSGERSDPSAYLFHPPITNVISTEGGALCRRSGEIPVFRLCSCLCLRCCLCCCCCRCLCGRPWL